LDTGSIKGTSSTKEAVLALNSRPLELAQCPPASLAEEAGNGALFVLANVVGSRPKVVEDSMLNVLLNQPVRDFSRKEVDPAQSISEIVREQEAIEVSPAIPVHNRKEINSEAIWEQMQKVQSEVSVNPLSLLSYAPYFWKLKRFPSDSFQKKEVSSIQEFCLKVHYKIGAKKS